MLTPDDLNAIGKLMDEKLRSQKTGLLVELSKARKELLDKMEIQKKEIVNDIGDLLNEKLLPSLDKRLEHLERHTAHPPGAAPMTS